LPSNCENWWNFDSRIWSNLELGSAAVRHQGNLMPPKSMAMLDDHISTTIAY
jgi:hypothetical protein